MLGNTTGLLTSLTENIGVYLTSFVGDNFNMYAYENKEIIGLVVGPFYTGLGGYHGRHL